MKKLLIASAALAMVAGTAQAQSSVQVYGILDIGYSDTKSKASAGGQSLTRQTTTTGNGLGGLATSRLGFQGSEDLGGGLKANFRLEYALGDVGAGGNTWGARESWVSLQDAKLGELKLGRQMTGTHALMSGFFTGYANNTVGSIYSLGSGDGTTQAPNENGMRPYQVFANRVVGYTSPNMGGLVVSAQYGENSLDTAVANDTNTKLKHTDIAARYTAGKLALGASYQQQKNTQNAYTAAQIDTATNVATGTMLAAGAGTGPGNLSYETTMVGASYNFGPVQPFALYTERENKYATTGTGALNGNIKIKATEAGVRAPVGKKTVLFASMYDGESKPNAAEKADLKGYQVGALYNLSKRTTAYAIMGEQKSKIAAGEVKTTGASAGVRHSF